MKKILLIFICLFSLITFACDKKEIKLEFDTKTVETIVNEEFTLTYSLDNSTSEINYTFSKEGMLELTTKNQFKALKEGDVVITATLVEDKTINVTINVTIKAIPHQHVFDKKVVEDKYLASEATYDSPAKYYYSCECGESGTESFESGEKLTKPTHKITYELNGGELSSNAIKEFKEGEKVVLETPTKDGYTFLGWTTTLITGYILEINSSVNTDITVVANWEQIIIDNVIDITYKYTEGHLPTRKATSLNEFLAVFWNELYKWSGSNEKIDSFKTSTLSSWKTGNAGAVKFYLSGGANTINNEYFVNTKGNEKWMEWMILFDSLVNEINNSQTAFGSTYVGYLRLYAFITQTTTNWNATRTQKLYEAYPVSEDLIIKCDKGQDIDLVELVIDDGRTFLGWYDEKNNKITNTKDLTKDITLVAKWSDSTRMESFSVDNKIDRLERLDTYQLEWTINPSNTTNKKLIFTSSNPGIIQINEEGLMTAIKDGKTLITVQVADNSSLNVSFEVTVYINAFIDITFNTESVVEVGKKISVSETIYGIENANVIYTVKDTSIASISQNGEITGISSGYTEIEATLEGYTNCKFTFGVTVVTTEEKELYKVIIDANNSKIHIKRDLNVAYEYLTDVYTSVSDLLFNYNYQINRDYEAKQATISSNHGGTKTSTEFICVHYTAGAAQSSTGAANANYFANGGGSAGSSIHYTTGNDGIFHILDDSIVGYHAGDGTGTTFKWTNTGVTATDNVKPLWGVIADGNSSTGYYFTINGKKTTVVVPTKGTKSNGEAATISNPASAFTYFGPAWKVVNGYYYIGTTWACFTQVASGKISSKGGNNNSIGIETACNKGSDLWLTYQYTAELIARLLDENNLDLSRVVGHNFFSGKDCPQTLLASNGELWEIFMECVEAEYNLYTQMTKNGKYTISTKSNNPDVLSDNGRIINIPNYTTSVSYTVTIKNTETNTTKDFTFYSIINGTYTE